MQSLPDDLVVKAYIQAHQDKLDQQFIDLLKKELIRRKIDLDFTHKKHKNDGSATITDG